MAKLAESRPAEDDFDADFLVDDGGDAADAARGKCCIPSGSLTHGCIDCSHTDTLGAGRVLSVKQPAATANGPHVGQK